MPASRQSSVSQNRILIKLHFVSGGMRLFAFSVTDAWQTGLHEAREQRTLCRQSEEKLVNPEAFYSLGHLKS